MMHFYRECPIRQRARAANSHHEWLSSDSHTPEDFRELHAKEPTRYCSLCLTIRTDSNRYAELRALVETWQHWQREPRYDQADAPERLMDWSHR
jgi:hypothetical protein